MNTGNDIALFFKKLVLFILPIFVVYSIPLATLYYSKELTSIDRIIEKQKNNEKLVLFGLAYSNPEKYYKYNSVIRRKPKVLALGTSRIMQFRSKFFKGNVFFNAGGGIGRVEHFEQFIDSIPKEKQPEIIIVSLDQYFFNSNWSSGNNDKDNLNNAIKNDQHWKDALTLGVLDKKIFEDYYYKKIRPSNLIQGENEGRIGISAVENSNGFRNDGSYYYGKTIANPKESEDYEFKNTFDRIAAGKERFEYGKNVSDVSVKELENFLKKCKDRGIYVVGYMPPYAHLVYEKIEQNREKYEYIFKLGDTLNPIFEKFDFGFYDFSDLALLGASDKETVDGFHGSEKAYLRLHISIAEKNEKYMQYSENLDILKKRLRESRNDYTVFENNEY